jgi:hypothetical protein
MGDWKLVKAPGAGVQAVSEARDKGNVQGAHLYNLANDIGEQNNLAEKEPQKFKELADAWNAWNAELVDAKWVPNRTRPAAARRANRQTDK